jgi:hypothetical protein
MHPAAERVAVEFDGELFAADFEQYGLVLERLFPIVPRAHLPTKRAV